VEAVCSSSVTENEVVNIFIFEMNYWRYSYLVFLLVAASDGAA